MAEQVYGNVTIKGFVIGPVVVNDYVLGVVKNADNDYALQIKRGGEEQMIPVVSPMLTTEAIEGGTRVTIEDISGTRSFDILNGKDGIDGKDGQDGKDGANGIDGQDGKDGVSPVVAVTEIENGHRVTITDAEGEKTFDVPNGGSGLPSGGEPYKQLVTDGEGKTVWEDRLGYMSDPVEKLIYEQDGITLNVVSEDLTTAQVDPSALPIVAGVKYEVTWNGTIYTCIGKNVMDGSNSINYIGNEVIFDLNNADLDTGEPFILMNVSNVQAGLYGLDGSTTVDLKLVGVEQEPVPIPLEYMPKQTLAQADWSIFDENDVSYVRNRPCYLKEYPYVEYTSDLSTITAGSSYKDAGLDDIQFLANTDYYITGEIYIRLRDDIARAGWRYDGVYTASTTGRIDLNSKGKMIPTTGATVSVKRLYGGNSPFYKGQIGISSDDTFVTETYCTVNLQIYEVKQLNGLMIPDDIQRVDKPIYLTSPNGTKYQVSVDNNGTLTVTDVDNSENAYTAPTDDHINSLIDAKLGAIENGTY